MTVARILANKGRSVVTTLPERTLQEVSVELMRHGIGALVVVDANDDIVGLISERDVVMAVAGRMSGQPLGEEARPHIAAMSDRENRVVIRCRPYATYATPPRHLHRNDEVEQLTHWVSGVVGWDAADPETT